MLDVSTDMTLVSSQFGGHVGVLEFDDLRVRVEQVTDAEVGAQGAGAGGLRASRLGRRRGLRLGCPGLGRARRLVEDFALDSVAYYHRGLDGEMHERLGAGMILGSSLLTARGIPMAGEYEVRTMLAMLVCERIGAGGSFTEFQALNFSDGVVEMGHDGPAHLAISSSSRSCVASVSTTASVAGA